MQTQPVAAKEKEFRVKSVTPPPELGTAIAHAIKSGNQVVLKAVGAGAINQAVNLMYSAMKWN
ncbi:MULTISPECIES: stage V sporulation protein S [unclassified Streptomyces]|uniref:stage V sporulation protein S n=1 Tax=unclassified Streptomyces TaxID=2593676 RepID=UPI003D89E9B0